MRKKVSLLISFILILTLYTTEIFLSNTRSVLVKANPKTIYMPDGYEKIQEAINAADPGDTIIVRSGNYTENILINKTVTLIGEERDTTVIDGGHSGHVIRIIASNVKIMNFTIKDSKRTSDIYSGIFLSRAVNVTICNNVIKNNIVGVNLRGGSNNTVIIANLILNNSVSGINTVENSNFNYIISNTLMNNTAGVKVSSSSFNIFYRNNFLDNTLYQAQVLGGFGNEWDNGAEGNYWSDYKGVDDGSSDPRTGQSRVAGDGVGDTELPVWGIDFNPLMEPWSMTRIYHVDSQVVKVYCNYTVSSFKFNQTRKQISFYITGPAGWKGFCDIKVPQALLIPNETSSERWIVMLGSNPPTNLSIISVNNSTLISFNYSLSFNAWENRVRLKIGVYYPPTANFHYAPTEATILTSVAFNDTSLSPNGTIVWRQWNFRDGNVIVTNATYFTHQFECKGIFNVTLTVRDDKNGSDSITKFVVVFNINPVANFTFSSLQPKVGEENSFFGNTSRDDDGYIIQWLWDFGDGTSSSVMNTFHKYQHVGIYNATLTVWDDDEASNSTTKSVVIGKGTTNIEINAPRVVKARRNFTITATLKDCANQPVAGERVVFYSDNEYLGNATTDNDGTAMISVRLSIVGTHQIQTQYEGSADYFVSNATSSIRFDPLNTTLIINVPQNVTQNEAVSLYGTLTDEDGNAVSSSTISFYVYNGSAWEKIDHAVTNQSGAAFLSFTPKNVGTLKLKGVFNGEMLYTASYSKEVEVTVSEKKTNYTVYIVLAIVIVVGVCALIILKKRLK